MKSKPQILPQLIEEPTGSGSRIVQAGIKLAREIRRGPGRAGRPAGAETTPDQDCAQLQGEKAAPRESSETLRRLLDKAPVGYQSLDDQGRLVDVSETWLKIMGYSRNEVIGRWFGDFLPPESGPHLRQRLLDLQESGAMGSVQLPMRRKDGARLLIEYEHCLEETVPGHLWRVHCLLRDLTERQRAEEALRQSEARYRAMFEHLKSGVAVYEAKDQGADFIIRDFNAAAEGMEKVQRQNVIGRSLLEVFPGVKEFGLLDVLRRVWKTGRPEHHPAAIYQDDKRTGWRENFVYQLPSGEVVAIYEDVTQRKRAEEDIIMAHAELNQIFHAAASGMWLLDTDFNILKANQTLANMLALDVETLRGRKCHEVFPGPHCHQPGCPLRRLLAGEKKIEIEEEKLNGHGAKTNCLVTAVIQQSPGGEILGVIQDFKDVTDFRRLEKQLIQAQKMEAIGTLAGGIAHDFNNILGAIMGYTELACHELAESHPTQLKLDQVLKACERAKNLVLQILSFSRQTEQERRPVRLGPIIHEALDLLRASLPKTIEIRENFETFPDLALADQTQIHQVLMNLCANAAHAMRQGGGRLGVSLKKVHLNDQLAAEYLDLSPGIYSRLTVSDTGHGMDRQTMERIFEPFFTTKPPGEGTGMGLSVIHGIVKSHGGTITVYSQPGQGSTFNVYLPLMEPEIKEQPLAHVSPIPTGSERVLLVDDEESLVELGRQMLERLGYRVTGCTSSSQALELFQARPDEFDVVITDQAMPLVAGDEMARRMMTLRPDLPVIICTGFSDQVSTAQAEARGVRAVILKPMMVQEIAEIIRTVLDGGRPAPAD